MSDSSQARTALAEWTAVVILLLGCAAIMAGVIALVLDFVVALILMFAGAGVAILAAIVWTVIVKRRDPNPRAARQEF